MRIRAHHLLCLSTFRGEGYSPDFVAHMWEVFHWARAGGEAVLVAEEDEICRPCPLKGTCRAIHRDRRLLRATGWSEGETVNLGDRIRELIPERARWVKITCRGCPWEATCSALTPTF